MASVRQRAAQVVVELFGEGVEEVGATVANYEANFGALESGLQSCVALHVLASLDNGGEAQVLRAVQSRWSRVLGLDNWWLPGARHGGLAFFKSLARGGPELLALVEGSAAWREQVVCQAFTMGLPYPVQLGKARVEEWARTGLLRRDAGLELMCEEAAEAVLQCDLGPLLASPLAPCGPLMDRLYDHAALALRAPDALGAFLMDRGGRRDYLALAPAVLLAQRVSLEEAAFLLQLLRGAWQERQTVEVLDGMGAVLSESLQAVFLIKSLAGPRAAEVVGSLFRSSVVLARVGLAALTRACLEGEARARERVIRLVEQTGYLGCLAHAMLAWTGQEVEPGAADSPDRHRHMTLKRSGAHYIIGETLEKEENDQFEFK